MKINWGTRIALLYISFVVMIITLVAATFRNKPVLVTADYYLLETKFQEQLDAERAVSDLEAPPVAVRTADSVHIVFPRSLSGQRLDGTITCYVPSDDAADKTVPFTSETAAFSFAAPRTSEPYQIRIDWEEAGVRYYYQIP